METHDCLGAECPACVPSPFRDAGTTTVGISQGPRAVMERLAMFRGSRGESVTRFPDRVAIGTTIIIPHGSHWSGGPPWTIVVHQRHDNGYWALPGGAQQVGETVKACATRETFEETGLSVVIGPLVDVHSDPRDGAICQYPDHQIVHYTNLTFLATAILSGVLRRSCESTALQWASTDNLPEPFLPTHLRRIQVAFAVVARGGWGLLDVR